MSRQRRDADFGLGFRGLVRDRRDDGFDQLAHVDAFRLEFAPALAGEVEDRGDQAVHLGDRRFDEAERFGKILAKAACPGPRAPARPSVAVRRCRWRQRRDAAKGRDAPENVAAQFLQLAGEAHDVDQRRAQIVADDIGEALDLVVGFAQVGGALVDGGFEIEIVVAQPGFGLVARARRAPHQQDRNAGKRDHEAGAGDGDAGGQQLAAIGVRRCAASSSRSSSTRIAAPTSRMVAWYRRRRPRCTSAVAACGSFCLTKFISRANWSSRVSIARAQLA